MKNNSQFIFFAALLILYVFSPLHSQAQFKVKKAVQIKEIQSGFNPIFTPKADKIIFSSQDNVGLSLYDMKTKAQKKLNSDVGSGFEACISADGKTVFYKSFIFDNTGKRLSTITAQDIESGKKTEIIKKQRNLSSVISQNKEAVFINNSELKTYGLKQKKLSVSNQTAAFTDHNMDLVIYKNGVKKTVNPLGKGVYIWVSLSPDKTKILFNKSGKGTYISDLQGKIITDLGRLHAAKWSANGKWVVGMDDYDNGHEFTSSQIIIHSANGKQKQKIELPNNKIALNPDISANNKKIVFHNPKGQVFIVKLKKKLFN